MFGKRPWDKDEAPEDSYSNEDNPLENNSLVEEVAIENEDVSSESVSDIIHDKAQEDSIES
jgi:hypothetical protein